MKFFENLVPIPEASEKTLIAEKTLRNWRCQGRYPQLFVKIGGKVFIDLGEFKNIVQEQKKKAAQAVIRQGFKW